MNIFFVNKTDKSFYVCPDTAIEKEAQISKEDPETKLFDYYVPDGIKLLKTFSFVYIKMERAGKSIKKEFIHRYYKRWGFGVHLLSENTQHGYEKILDNSIFLGPEFYIEDTEYDDKELAEIVREFAKLTEIVSEYVSLRTGDIIAFEKPDDQSVEVKPECREEVSIPGITIQIIS